MSDSSETKTTAEVQKDLDDLILEGEILKALCDYRSRLTTLIDAKNNVLKAMNEHTKSTTKQEN